MYKIIIIGSDSYIGSAFILANQGKYSMKLFSRLDSGKAGENIRKDFFKFSKNDFINSDCILNFAAIVHQQNFKNDLLYENINTKLPIYLANESKKNGVRHFIQMSSIAVYGETSNVNSSLDENPNNIYGKTKLNADRSLLALQDENFKVSIIRPPLVYGGRKAPGNMQKLINVAQRGIPMPFKSIKNERDFINVRNLVRALNTVIDNKIFGIIIPTDRKPVSTEEIIEIVKKHSKSKVQLIKVPNFFLMILKKLKPSIYNKVFGSLKVACNIPQNLYKPISTIEDGIKEMINLK